MGYDVSYDVYYKTDNGYEKICLFDKNGKDVSWKLFPSRDHELNDCFFKQFDYTRGVPEFLEKITKEEYYCDEDLFFPLEEDERKQPVDWDTFDVTFYDYLELIAWEQTSKAVVEIEDEYGVPAYEKNVLTDFLVKVEFLAEVAGKYSPRPGDVIVVAIGSW